MARAVLLALALLSFSASGFCKREPVHLLPGRITLVPGFVQQCPNVSIALTLAEAVQFKRKGRDLLIDADGELSRRAEIKEGMYHGRNMTIDIDLLRMLPLPLEKYYWLLRNEAFDYERWMCVELGVRFMRTRH